MTPDEASKLVVYLAKLFPNQLTQEQGKLAAEQFRGHESHAAVLRAIKNHRINGADGKGFIDWKNLFEGCRAANESASEKQPPRDQSWSDVYRRQRPDLKDRCDAEVVLRVHRGWWFGGARKQSCYRGQIERSCRVNLASAGMTWEAAGEWASAMFDESPDYFRECLAELRLAI